MSAAKKKKHYLPELELITPIHANLFNVIFLTKKGEEISDMMYQFFSYEKVVLGRESFIKTHYLLTNENLKILDVAKEICNIQVESHNNQGLIYLSQKFEVNYQDYQISQNVNDDSVQNVSFIYKIIDQETTWTDYF